ncbi:5-hydroxytryptamine receptor 1F [Hypomesus transpacificus]|uniref:5-hydroxytryptamine receptor 1F n=1 Tax=Hypomesus transpacificus TaxID=137520 RepID=UPI001F076D49|nr:5-hydroxytryptamine receptor 1F [Hypomesus transpacificus]
MDLSNFSSLSLPYAEPQASRSNLSKILLTLALSLLAVATTCINSLVITAIAVTRKLHQPANYLICSLAVTDLLVAVLVMPVSIVYFVEETWVLGPAMCHLWLGIDVTCCTCSILHLAAIALDRYRAITDAVEYARKRTCRRALVTIAAVWVISVFVSLPPLVWRKQGTEWPELIEQVGNGQEVEDGGMMVDDSCLIEHDHVVFTLYSTFGAFYVPLVLILVLYYKIYRAATTLSHRRAAGRTLCQHTVTSHILPAENSDRELPLSPDTLSPTEKSFSEPSVEGDRAHITTNAFHPLKAWQRRAQPGGREHRAATTLGLILGAFVVCWLPFFLKEVVVNTCESCSTSAALADFLTWLGYLNSFINPLIYTIFNQDFKRAFQKLLRCVHY